MGSDEATIIMDALSNPSRLAVFKLLTQHHELGLKPTELAIKLNIVKTTLSFHLSLLSQAGLILAKKSGREITYYPVCSKITNLTAYLLDNCCSGNQHCH